MLRYRIQATRTGAVRADYGTDFALLSKALVAHIRKTPIQRLQVGAAPRIPTKEGKHPALVAVA